MDQKKKGEIICDLEAEKNQLQKEIKELNLPPDFGDYPGDDDETDEAEEYYNRKASASALKERLSEVEAALLRVEKGTFGACEQCRRPITEDVLRVNLKSRRCQDCNKSHRR